MVPDVAVVIPVRNEARSLPRLLASLQAQTQRSHEVIVVDAASEDGTATMAQALKGDLNLRVVRAPATTYPGAGRNLGVRAARSEWVAFTDAGIRLDPRWLEELCQVVRRDPSIGVVYGHYEPVRETLFQRCAAFAFVSPVRRLHGQPLRNHFIASSLIRRDVWEAVGGFPEELRSAEDLVFMSRVAASGVKVAACPSAVVHWELPENLWSTFRRFRLYSRFNLQAGFAGNWHVPLLRLYSVSLLLAAAAFVWRPAASIAVLGSVLMARAIRRLWRWGARLTWRTWPSWGRDVLLTSLVLLVVDVATLCGAIDWTLSRCPRYGRVR